jgi:hypothetical protein
LILSRRDPTEKDHRLFSTVTSFPPYNYKKKVIHTLKENVSLLSRFRQWNVISTAILEEEVSSACTVNVLRRACPEPLRRFNVMLWLNFVTICKKKKLVQSKYQDNALMSLSLLYLHIFREIVYCN